MKNSGYTLVELVVVMAIGSFVVSALLFFFSGSITSYRSQVGHIFATADARNQVQRMTDVIRNTQDKTSNDWLQEASDDAIAVYTDVEGDGVLEKVAYRRSSIDTTQLIREVTLAGASEATSSVVMQNIASTPPLFTYYDANGNSITTPANRTSLMVKNIGISVTVQSRDPKDTDTQTVVTRITPRSKLQGDVSQITGPSATREVSIQLPSGNPPPANANTVVITKDTGSGATLSTKTISFSELNDGRLSVYANKLYAILNYKTDTGLGNNEGWYVWISKSVPAISNLFQLPLSSLYTSQCLGVSWATVQVSSTSSCVPLDTALYPIASSETFQPIITYTEGDYRDYVRDIIIAPLVPFANGQNAIDLIGQYVNETDNPLVPLYTKKLPDDGQAAVNKLGLRAVHGFVLDSAGHRLFVSDQSNNRVLVYNLNPDNTLIDRIPDHVLGQTNFTTKTLFALTRAQTSVPYGLAYDAQRGLLFVAEALTGYGRVMVFDVATITDGENAVHVLGTPSFTTGCSLTNQSCVAGSLSALAYDSVRKLLFVAQPIGIYGGGYVPANRVLVFDVATITDGENAVKVFGQADFTSHDSQISQSRFGGPWALAYDNFSKRLFVAPTESRVLVFNVATIANGQNAVNVLGQADFNSSSNGTTINQMYYPRGLAYDSVNNRLFISDLLNHRVLAFDVATIANGQNAVNVLGQADFNLGNNGTTQSRMYEPDALLYDGINNRLYVADTKNNRILLFSTQ